MGRSLRVLLDTHTYYWWVYQKDRLTRNAVRAIEQSDVSLVSLVSYWELAIKMRTGKMKADTLLSEGPSKLGSDGLELLGIEFQHLQGTLHLPLHHRDPFDRLLVAQARVEKLSIVSADTVLDGYDVTRIW